MAMVVQRKILSGALALVFGGTLFAYLSGTLNYANINVLEAPEPEERAPAAPPLCDYGPTAKDAYYYKRPMGDKSPLRSIVFLETAGHDELTARQACAVESAARAHPQAQVKLLHTALKMNLEEPVTRLLLEPSWSQSFGNVIQGYLNLSAVFRDTPLESWYNDGKWKESQFLVNHMSDALRLAVLHRHGGVYMDLDVVVLRPLDDLSDFVGLEEPKLVANGVLGFRRKHPFLLACMRELSSTYRPDLWSHNGPELMTRVLKRFCGGEDTQDLDALMDRSGPRCRGVAAVPPGAFYPVHWQNWVDYYNSSNAAEVIIGWSGSYLIHVWNRLTAKMPVSVGSGQPYEVAAKKFCPSVYGIVRTSGVM